MRADQQQVQRTGSEEVQQVAEVADSQNSGGIPRGLRRDRIACLPKIMEAIIEKNGGRTKY
jgi:hypothetical protein